MILCAMILLTFRLALKRRAGTDAPYLLSS